ncbi:SIR2 family protein [uncultured Methanolobus sp.]|uniref:SIR2 family protein n=1 Tax=uncultured Methanolobus sp. TaxID=218300 RepID=UPI002AAC291D|nr:SIR2 family protein [uncultured Methanolobus sp.]
MNDGVINWDEEKVVFFFGAGASKPEGGIITNQLLEESFRQFPRNNKVKMVKEYLSDIYHNNCEISNLPTFEEVLGPIDIALQKQENMSPKWDVKKLSTLRDNLIYCICSVLYEKLQNPRGYHHDFVDNLLTMYPGRWNKCSFISLNYDILLDNALTKLGDGGASNIDLNYGIRFRNEKHRRSGHQNDDTWSVPRVKNVPLLKLHGSLNWIYCPTCNSIKITPKRKGIVDDIFKDSEPCDSPFCKDGASEQKPIVVPPTFTKAYENPFLVSIWLQAEKVLQNATRIYFIGYSMPEADIHIQYLLKRSLFRQNGIHPKIIIIDKKNEHYSENDNDENMDENVQENMASKAIHDRYKRLFGDVKYCPIGFEKFAGNLEQYL